MSKTPAREPAHDVLAAEAFAVPARDPSLHSEPAHDVLAAEAFAVPAPDPRLHPEPVVVPDDPTGIAEPHDVLAAEEFPMPAGFGTGALDRARGEGPRRLVAVVLAVAGLVLLLRRLRRRGQPERARSHCG